MSININQPIHFVESLKETPNLSSLKSNTLMHKDQLASKELSDLVLSVIIQIIYNSEQYSY